LKNTALASAFRASPLVQPGIDPAAKLHVNARIVTNVGMDLWNDTQKELTRLRAKK
jgi:hypothetical protein